jgi:hypothetical protein
VANGQVALAHRPRHEGLRQPRRRLARLSECVCAELKWGCGFRRCVGAPLPKTGCDGLCQASSPAHWLGQQAPRNQHTQSHHTHPRTLAYTHTPVVSLSRRWTIPCVAPDKIVPSSSGASLGHRGSGGVSDHDDGLLQILFEGGKSQHASVATKKPPPSSLRPPTPTISTRMTPPTAPDEVIQHAMQEGTAGARLAGLHRHARRLAHRHQRLVLVQHPVWARVEGTTASP